MEAIIGSRVHCEGRCTYGVSVHGGYASDARLSQPTKLTTHDHRLAQRAILILVADSIPGGRSEDVGPDWSGNPDGYRCTQPSRREDRETTAWARFGDTLNANAVWERCHEWRVETERTKLEASSVNVAVPPESNGAHDT